MNKTNTSLALKLENSFLSILRVVILIVLSVSLIGAVVLGVSGVSDMNAKPTSYTLQAPDQKALIDELRQSLQEQTTPANTQPQQEAPSVAQDKSLDQEIEKQVQLVSKFLNRFELSLTSPERFGNRLKKNATDYALDKSDAGQLAYAKGQTQFFETVFADEALMNAVTREKLDGFFDAVTSVYADAHIAELERKSEFEAEQQATAAATRAGSMMKLYAAGGMFAAFLLISLILVLVKIERNLRPREAA